LNIYILKKKNKSHYNEGVLMRNKETLFSISLASATLVLFFILFPFTALAASEQNSLFKINETRITTSESASLPDIYGNYIVWQNGTDADFTNIGVYDLSTHKETKISTNLLTVPREPKIYGDRVVWIDSKNGSYNEYGDYDIFDIYMYNLSTSEKTQITTSGSASWPTVPVIYGNRIVWDETRNNSTNVYVYDLSIHKETQITNEWGFQRPAVYDDRIVWEKTNSSQCNDDICVQRDDVHVYNISTNNTTRIINGKANYYRLAISGDNIAWQSWINGGSDVNVYNLSTGKNTQITNNGGALCPDIYGDRIVWTDDRNGNADIYMYNLSTSRETQITNNPAAQACPAIYENKIVWEDYRNGNKSSDFVKNSDIYMGIISGEEPEFKTPFANMSSNASEGNASLSVQYTNRSENETGTNTTLAR